MNYEGHAFHKDFPKGKASGTISTTPQGILFRNDRSEITLPYNGIDIELGGAANRIIFIQHPNEPDWRFYTSKQSILQDPIFKTRIGSMTQINKIKSKNLKLIGLDILLICFSYIILTWCVHQT